MRSSLRRLRPSPAMLVAFAALLVALGGTSYAVVRLPANSVSTKQLKKGAVTRDKIKADAVDASKVGANALTGDDISESTLGPIPAAQTAARATTSDRAANSDHANATAAIDKVSYRTVSDQVPAAVVTNAMTGATQTGLKTATAGCDPGQHVTGGGVKVEDTEQTSVVDTYPDASGTAWSARVDNADTAGAHAFTVYAICVVAVATG